MYKFYFSLSSKSTFCVYICTRFYASKKPCFSRSSLCAYLWEFDLPGFMATYMINPCSYDLPFGLLKKISLFGAFSTLDTNSTEQTSGKIIVPCLAGLLCGNMGT